MEHSVFKVFFSKIKENDWLNLMGQQGYLLKEINDSKYLFSIDNEKEIKYSYSIEYLDFSPNSDKAVAYYQEREHLGIVPLISSGNWVYFVSSECDIEINEEGLTKNAAFYFIRSLYLLFFTLCASILTGYQIFAKSFLEKIGLHGDGRISKLLVKEGTTDFFESLLNGLKSVVNYLFKMANGYFRIWTNIFGNNDAVAVISILIPIIILLLIIATFNLDEYYGYTKLIAKLKVEKSEGAIQEGETNEEQEI